MFAATDVFLFYVLFEAMLIPMYFLIGRFGGPRRQYAAVKFFLYSLLGGLIMLASVIGAVRRWPATSSGQGTFDWADAACRWSATRRRRPRSGCSSASSSRSRSRRRWCRSTPGCPTPVPRRRSASRVLLVGVLDKVGTFGFLRYCLPLFPQASRRSRRWCSSLAVIGILYGALLAVGQRDMKRFVAYTSIAHFGFIALGIFAFSTQAVRRRGALHGQPRHLDRHAVLVVGMLDRPRRLALIADYGGVAKIAPLLAGVFLLAGLSSLALPGTNSFVSEFLVLVGSYPREPVFTILATVGIIFAALYVLWLYQRTMQGPVRGDAVLGARARRAARAR